MGMTHNQADTKPLLALHLGWVERGHVLDLPLGRPDR
jgi:hypothetical protein